MKATQYAGKNRREDFVIMEANTDSHKWGFKKSGHFLKNACNRGLTHKYASLQAIFSANLLSWGLHKAPEHKMSQHHPSNFCNDTKCVPITLCCHFGVILEKMPNFIGCFLGHVIN
jgi:hypothetical protein